MAKRLRTTVQKNGYKVTRTVTMDPHTGGVTVVDSNGESSYVEGLITPSQSSRSSRPSTASSGGPGLVEYALIIVLISIVAITIMTNLGPSITNVFSQANQSLTSPGRR